MDFNNYDLNPTIYDEMFLPSGMPREVPRRLLEALAEFSQENLPGIQERVTRSFSHEGITFTVYGDDEAEERIIPVDCIPRVIAAAEWDYLERGLVQRLNTLNRFLNDVYGEGRIIQEASCLQTWCAGAPSTALRCAGWRCPTGSGSPFAVRTKSAPMTASLSWRITCGSPQACPA